MLHPIKKKLARLRRVVRMWLVIHGLSWFVAIGLGTALALGSLDCIIRFRDTGVRVIFSLVLLVVLGWACYRHLLRIVTTRLDDVELARRVQRRFPSLNDSLASAVEFLKQSEDEPTAGSPSLRRAVVAKTTAEVEDMDFSAVVDRRPLGKAMTAALGVCLLAGVVTVMNPLGAQIALARLAYPLGKLAFPRNCYLTLRDRVDRVALGQAFEIEVVDAAGARLPFNTRIYYRIEQPDGSIAELVEPMRPLGRAMVARRENVTRPFSYRIEGGDDLTMDWIAVEVVEPPAVASLEVVLAPPDYSGVAASISEGHLRVLHGTRARFQGVATSPLAHATFVLDDGHRVSGAIGSDARTFTIPPPNEPSLVLERSGAYRIELVDRGGLIGGQGDRWEIRVLPDQPPVVTIERPSGAVFVTPQAEVPLRAAAKDDLALRRIDLVIHPPGLSPSKPTERQIPLYVGPDQVAPPMDAAAGAPAGDARVVDYRWDLADLNLAPGQQVPFHATAADYRPQSGSSDARRLVVITPEQLIQRLSQQQRLLLAELTRAVELVRQSRGEVARLEGQLHDHGHLAQPDIDQLQGADLTQRQATRTLTSATDGVPMHIDNLLGDLANNKVDSPEITARMQSLLDEILRLGREELAVIARELTSAIKSAQVGLEEPGQGRQPGDDAVEASLAVVVDRQDRLIESLAQMVGQLAEWDNYRRFHREIAQLAAKQEDLLRAAIAIGRGTLARDVNDLTAQETAELSAAGRDQLELGRVLDRLLQEMDQTGRQIAQRDPDAGKIIARAVASGRDLGTSARMRAAGEHTLRNQIGRATELQRQAWEDLQEMLDILANRRDADLELIASSVKNLRDRQNNLADETRQFDASREGQAILPAARAERLAELTREQRLLEDETSRISSRLDAPVIRLALFQAGTEMARAAGWLERLQTGAPSQDAQEAALARLAMLIDALKMEPSEPAEPKPPAEGGQQAGQAAPQRPRAKDALPLAQLKLLRLLQQDLTARTEAWQNQFGADAHPSCEARRSHEQLATEQGQLADLLLDLVPPETSPEEEDLP